MPQVRLDPETKRLLQMSLHEERLAEQGYRCIAGVDEAGRGPLAGPVVAAACILPPAFLLPHLNDSKQLTAARRQELFAKLTSDPRIVYAVAVVGPARIDEINILRASLEAMKIAVEGLSSTPDYLLIDGPQLPPIALTKEGIIDGDAHSISIAAASVIAKVTRDALMAEEALRWPGYGFERHKGYGTAQHFEALKRLGPCPIHRRSFAPVLSTQDLKRGAPARCSS